MDKNNQLALMYPQVAHSRKLTACLLKMEAEETKSDAKMELISISRGLMPEGKPDFHNVVNYPMVRDLIKVSGDKPIIKILFLLVKDFCASLNVVRNMTEDQQIEAASLLLDECGNFRLEDYVMMFQLAKRGELGKVYDRLDLEVISSMLDAYWMKRRDYAETMREKEEKRLNSFGPVERSCLPEDTETPGIADSLKKIKWNQE